MYIGYVRASTPDQSLDLQMDALKKVGCKKIFVDEISGPLRERPALKNLIRERAQTGRQAARARDRNGGRPKSLDEQRRKLAVELYAKRQLPVKEICKTLGISKPTLYAYVRAE